MLTAPTKTKEKPSMVSKKVLKTHHKNGTESYLLTEKIKTLEYKQSQKNIDIDMEVNSLKKKMEAVQRVKEKISLSKERRMLLKSQGYTIRVCKGGKDDEIFLRRDRDHDSLQVDAGNWATLLANPPESSPASESLELQHVDEFPEDSSSSSENRPDIRTRIRSFSFSSVVDSRPTQISRYRVIEPPLRPGSRRGFTSLSATTPKPDQEIRQEFNKDSASERAPTRWEVLRNRPMSGRSLFVEAVIAAKESNYFTTNPQSIARERMENYRRRKLKTGSSRRTMSAPVMKIRSAICLSKDQKEEDQKISDKKELQCTSEAEPDSNGQKNSTNLKLGKVDSLTDEGKKETSENITATSEGNLINGSKLVGLNKDQHDRSCLSGASSGDPNTEKKDYSTQDNTGYFSVENEGKERQDERNEERRDASRQPLIKFNQKLNERSKTTNRCNEVFPRQTSQGSTVEIDADVLNPVPLNGQEVVPSEDADEKDSSHKNRHGECACAVDSGTAVQETSGKTYLSVPDNTVTSRMSNRRHSSDDCEINNARFHGSREKNQYARKDSLAKGHVTLQIPRSSMLNRRMSHPPRLANFQGDDKLRRRKSLRNEDEVVYAYDARPDKSLSKGYRAMQMTVGGRQVKINMPSFPKESGTIMADRVKLNSKLSSFRGKN